MRTYEFVCARCGKDVRETAQNFEVCPEHCAACRILIQNSVQRPSPPRKAAVPKRRGASRLLPSCRTCRGCGKVSGELCPSCQGSGVQAR
ncbi:MAG: hypothetical protein WCU88_08760 [Elusimicrobiota bacterium]|jgi:hypothetical protein